MKITMKILIKSQHKKDDLGTIEITYKNLRKF